MIRLAESKDIEFIMSLLQQVNNVHAKGRPDIFIPNNTKYRPEDIENILSDSSTPVFVYTENEDIPLAYCFCIIQDHTESCHLQPVKTLYIDDLCVDEKKRCRHIGKQLFEHVREWAHNNGFYNITLNVWNCNPGAYGFYQNLGMSTQKITLETIL